MADEKEPLGTPAEDRSPADSSAVENSSSNLSESSSAKPQRDPLLEELLKSRSGDDLEGYSERGSKTKRGSRARAKTGTSLDRKSRKSRAPLVAGIVAAVLLLSGGGAAAWLYMAPEKSQIDESRNESKTQKAKGSSESELITEEELEDAPWTKEGKEFPVEKASWSQRNHELSSLAETKGEIYSSQAGNDLWSAASSLPSEASGFTSDDSKELLEDGTLNPNYSFWTQELFLAESGSLIERLINPTYGNWTQLQYSGTHENFTKDTFADMFTNSWWKANEGKSPSEYMPIYADWNGNDYGIRNLATGPRWYGEITSSNTDFVYDEESLSYVANFTGDVKFTSYLNDGSTVSKKGTLQLELIANQYGDLGSGGKVLINKANLSIGG